MLLLNKKEERMEEETVINVDYREDQKTGEGEWKKMKRRKTWL